MEEVPSDQFVIPDGLWFIIPRGFPADPLDWAVGALRIVQSGEQGVVAFTDRDQADRYLELGGDQAKPYTVGRPGQNTALLAVLSALAGVGVNVLFIDPGNNNAQRTIVQDLMRRLGALEGR